MRQYGQRRWRRWFPVCRRNFWARRWQQRGEIGDAEVRAKALAALIPHLPPELLGEMLVAVRAIEDGEDRAEALAALVPHLAGCPVLDDQFPPTLRVLAQHGRPALLRDLVALMPWLTALAERRQPALWAALFAAIIETAQCWP
jgi:hypothetical protein